MKFPQPFRSMLCRLGNFTGCFFNQYVATEGLGVSEIIQSCGFIYH